MKLAIASDHAGFAYKNELLEWLKSQGHNIMDFGTDSDKSCDYPDYAYPAAEAVLSNIVKYAILICGTGIGVSITANKLKGIRAADCVNVEMARLSRSHNNANVLTFGSRLISIELAKEIITTFLNTEFEGGRHKNRVEKIHLLTGR